MNGTLQEQFARWVDLFEFAYNLELRSMFVREARAFLQRLADDLGLAPGTYSLRVDRGGIGSSGEVTLRHDRFLVRLNADLRSPEGKRFIWRACAGRGDWNSGPEATVYYRDLAGDGYRGFVDRLQLVTQRERFAA
jgi:hypothetical protein